MLCSHVCASLCLIAAIYNTKLVLCCISITLFLTLSHVAPGYGVRSPSDCWLSAWIVALQSIWAALLNAVTLGIVFARISQPKQRARTIFISDSAVISRRDGVLKFMFRIADIRNTQVGSTQFVLSSTTYLVQTTHDSLVKQS